MKSTQLSLLALTLTLFTAAPLLAGERGEGYGHGKRGGHAKAMLGKLDSDGDGKVTVAEITAMAAQRTQGIDANGDGVITIAELEAHREKQRQARQAARFARLDSNGDGIVSAAEFTESQTKRLIALDTNGDGEISAEEAKAGKGWRGKGRRGGEGRGAR